MLKRLQLTDSPNIEHISSLSSQWNNMLMGIGNQYELHLPNHQISYQVIMKPWVNKVIPRSYIGVAFGINGLISMLWLSAWPLAERLQEYAPSGDLHKIPAELQMELVETVYEPFISHFEDLLKTKIKIYKLFFDKPFKSTVYSIRFTLKAPDELSKKNGGLCAVLVPQARLVSFFHHAISQLPKNANSFWQEQTTRVYFEIGALFLSVGELRGLEASDILFVHDSNYFQDNLIRVRWSSGEKQSIFHASADQVEFKSREIIMAEEEQELPIVDIEDMPVVLTFDMGDELLTFRQVEQIKPGHILNLKKPFTNLVTIRSQNQAIGQGEVVDIEGKVGIRITRLFNKNK